MLARFRALEPGIVVEVAAGNALFDLGRRDADLAIRPTATVPEHLIARRASTVAFAPYAAPPPSTVTLRPSRRPRTFTLEAWYPATAASGPAKVKVP